MEHSLLEIPPVSTPSQYRIEHRENRLTTVLGVHTGTKLNWRTLDPYVSHLLLEGRTGTVVLVQDATGWVLARRTIERAAVASIFSTPRRVGGQLSAAGGITIPRAGDSPRAQGDEP